MGDEDSSTASSSGSFDGSDHSKSSSSSGSSSQECEYVHLDKDWCPGTKKLREVAREVAKELECPKYSKKISKQILKEMEGIQFFRSVKNDTDSSNSDSSDGDSDDNSSSDDDSSVGEYGFGCYIEDDEVDIDDDDDVEEIRKKDLHEALRPFYEGERFMIENEAHCRDVYFSHPNHPGTQAFVRASQQLVVRQGPARDYDERTFKRMKRLLYDSEFFVGKAPEYTEADDDQCNRIFQARYEFDRKMIRKVIADNRKARPIPGTVCIKCVCCAKKDPNKKTCLLKILGCVPKAMSVPVLAGMAFVSFGFVYFGVYYIFKTIITTVYVALGVSISFFFGDGDEETTEAPTIEATEAPTLAPSLNATLASSLNTTLASVAEEGVERYLRNRL